MKNKNKDNFDEEEKIPDYLKDNSNNVLPEPEKLIGKAVKLAEPLIPVFGEEFCQKVFSKTWGLREQAVIELMREYPNAGRS